MNVLSLQLICFTHKSIFTQSSNDFVIIRYNLSGLTLNPNGILNSIYFETYFLWLSNNIPDHGRYFKLNIFHSMFR